MTDVERRDDDGSGRPYLVVSVDSHAGPSLEHHLRAYCPPQHLEEFDQFAAAHRAATANGLRAWSNNSFTGTARTVSQGMDADFMTPEARRSGLAMLERILENPGSSDPQARLRDMDEQGIASEVIFAGAQNREVLPWAGGTDAGSTAVDPALRVVGAHIWNEWLADFCATAPERLLGVAQIPIWDVDAAIREVRWAKEHGLRALNFPAPRPDYPAYNATEVYDRFWSAVEEVQLPLVTHSASGEPSSGTSGEGATMLFRAEVLWLSRRGLGQLIFGRVFDRHPELVVAFVEQRGNWVRQTLADFDSSYLSLPQGGSMQLMGAPIDAPARRPSEYWAANCILGDSFMAPFEVEVRDDIGIETMMWGTDYPHLEGTWPHTSLALRHTFAGVPEADVRTILGTNGARVFRLDLDVLAPVVERIGPTPADVDRPVAPEEYPAYRGLAFRAVAAYH